MIFISAIVSLLLAIAASVAPGEPHCAGFPHIMMNDLLVLIALLSVSLCTRGVVEISPCYTTRYRSWSSAACVQDAVCPDFERAGSE